uniref:Uncharacterized protein n=1 Tax=Trypanosoma vivax (strain Y486) TaxID=1055687 RepID=G0UBZ1_TRYVY|nr:conserved hypothetical protein [Trypanosoma vivax Y486]
MNSDNENENDTSPSPAVLAQLIIDFVGQLQQKQNSWNEEMHQIFLTEERQKRESDMLSERVLLAEEKLLRDGAFKNWKSRREALGVGGGQINEWYHADSLVSKTPFMAIAPCPRGLSEDGQMEVVKVVDALELPRFLIQTVPLHLPLSQLAPTFIPSAFHVPGAQRMSKSCLGALSYVGVPCTYGGDVFRLIAEHPILAAAVDRTPCLFLNDHIPRAAICAHCVVISGRCIAAEIACDVRLAEKLGLSNDDVVPDSSIASTDALSGALKEFVEGQLTSTLTNRSFRAIVIGKASPNRERELLQNTQPLLEEDLCFQLLNIDTLDCCEFECFTMEEILSEAQKMSQHDTNNRNVTPALRFLRPPKTIEQ